MENSIGERLKKLRQDYGFTQKQVADYLGFKQSQIAKLENNERKLKSYSLNKLCELYNCSYEYILKGEGEYSKSEFAFRSNNKNLDLETLAGMNRIIQNLNHLSKITR